jgi:hypothetical protein
MSPSESFADAALNRKALVYDAERLHHPQAARCQTREAVPPGALRAAVESGVARVPYPAHYPR